MKKDQLRVILLNALRSAHAELERLMQLHMPKYAGKLGEPSLEVLQEIETAFRAVDAEEEEEEKTQLRLQIAQMLGGDELEQVLYDILDVHQVCSSAQAKGEKPDESFPQDNVAYEEFRLERYAKLADKIIDLCRQDMRGAVL